MKQCIALLLAAVLLFTAIPMAAAEQTQITLSGKTEIEVGESAAWTAEVSPAEQNTAVTWKSGWPAVATVDENGVVTGHRTGECHITAVAPDGTTKTDANGNPIYKPRPSTLATRYYYRDADNNIVQWDADGDIDGRLYPVKTKWFESEYLADAQFDAVYELANARYVDNIVIDNNKTVDPIDFSAYPLYTKVALYYEGKLYKTLPISEKNTTFDASGENVKIKLGFKKILLTEIIKK